MAFENLLDQRNIIIHRNIKKPHKVKAIISGNIIMMSQIQINIIAHLFIIVVKKYIKILI